MPERGEQGRRTDCGDVAELLPVYLNRSLDLEEARSVEAHLADCAACRHAERETRTALALFEGHLPAEQLVDYALEQPMSSRRLAVIESHLAACERCAEEVAIVRGETLPDQRATDATGVEPVRPVPAPVAQRSRSALRALAWAACLVSVVASAGWIWTWRQLVHERSSAAASRVRANLPVVELLPVTSPRVRSGGTEAEAPVDPVELPEGDEIIMVLLSGGGACESGCVLEIYAAGEARPGRRIEGLLPSPDEHLTLSLPRDWLPPSRSLLAVRDPSSGELVAEYLVEVRHRASEGR